MIAEMLSSSATKELALPQTSLHVPIPATFSMLEAPEQVISFVSSLALTHRHRTISDVFVDFSKVVSQDLGAHALFDKLIDEIVSQAKFQKTMIGWKGNFPADAAQRRFVSAMGIIKLLGLTRMYLAADDAARIHLFERHCRHYLRQIRNVSPTDKSEQANAAERFANHINRCLAREGLELTDIARSYLCSYVVEIIDNAENHAGMVDWTIQGYLDVANENPECEIVILNFGSSIAATLDALPVDSYTSLQIKQYLELHAKNGWFSPRWRREDLLTLVALQGSVSSRNTSEESTRGQGTADLIEFFQRMNDERRVANHGPASMYIVSGSTQVLFDGRYRMSVNSDGSRVIAFNEANDLRQPPDQNFVRPLLGCPLPGTMIGIKFPIQKPSLQPVRSAEMPASKP